MKTLFLTLLLLVSACGQIQDFYKEPPTPANGTDYSSDYYHEHLKLEFIDPSQYKDIYDDIKILLIKYNKQLSTAEFDNIDAYRSLAKPGDSPDANIPSSTGFLLGVSFCNPAAPEIFVTDQPCFYNTVIIHELIHVILAASEANSSHRDKDVWVGILDELKAKYASKCK